MNKTIIEKLNDAKNETNKRIVEKRYLINNEIVSGKVDISAVEPLRILESLLIKKGVKIKKTLEGYNPWNIKELQIDCEEFEMIKSVICEIMEYRCCPELEIKYSDIVRQLPYNIMLQVSNAIMNYGKDPRQHIIDLEHSEREWDFYSFLSKKQGIDINGNPNEINDQLVVPKDEPQKRKHLIYKSSRGGYNIKTQNYRDSSMDHYCWMDSKQWD